MKVNILITIFIMIIFSCNKKTVDCGDPTSPNCKIILVDRNYNWLVGTTYLENQIELKSTNHIIPIIINNGVITINFYNIKSFNHLDLFLKLNETDIDTLNFYLRTFENECFTMEVLDTLKYNGRIINQVTGNSYKILK